MNFTTFTLAVLACLSLQAQPHHEFTTGIGCGLGISPISVNTRFSSSGNDYTLRSMISSNHNIAFQYLLGDRFGIESGFQATIINYRSKETHNSLKHYAGWKPITKLSNIQIPLLLVLKRDHPSNPYQYFKFTAGTSLHWLTTDFLVDWKPMPWLKNVVAGVRIGNNRNILANFEYGLEFQHSDERIVVNGVANGVRNQSLSTKLNILIFKFYYFIHYRQEKTASNEANS